MRPWYAPGHMSADDGNHGDDQDQAAGQRAAAADDPEPEAIDSSSPGASADAGESASREPTRGAADDARSRSSRPPEDPGPPPPASVPLPPPAYSPKVSPAPEITEAMPGHGPTIGGTAVTVSGVNLFRESIVRFGGEIARTTGAHEPRQLKVEAPPCKAPSVVDITIQNPGAELATLAQAFRYERLPAPVISSVAPTHLGPKGGGVSVTGKGFVADTVVLLGGEPAPAVTYVDSTTLEVQVPGGTQGAYVDVVVLNPDQQRALARRAFVYDERYG